MEIIRTNQVTKRFGSKAAVNNISIHVNEGEIYGFLGLNGAGKTTLIRMLLGMITPTEGDITLFGRELTPDFGGWNNVGYLVETPHAYPNLSVEENLRVYYRLRNLKSPDAISSCIRALHLESNKDTKARYLSLGNQQRLGLAKALMHQPRLLILDEPINGLDPEGIVEVRSLLKKLASQGTTIFLSSHILGEISRVASRIAIIHEGNLIMELTTAALSDQLVKTLRVVTRDNHEAMARLMAAGHPALLNSENEIELSDTDALTNPERVTQLLVEQGIPPGQVYLFTEDLEMYFLRTIRMQTHETTD